MPTDESHSDWHRPESWRGGPLGIYHAPRDPRVWVPKRDPAFGWTLNFARRAAWGWIALVLGVALALVAARLWVAVR